MPKTKAVTFDLDGVLVDMVEIHYEALNQALREVAHFEILPHEQKWTFNGLATRQKLDRLIEQQRLLPGQVESVYTLKQQYTQAAAQSHMHNESAARAVLDTLRRNGYRLACVSNCIRPSVHYLLGYAGLLDAFDVLISNEDVHDPKPAPDPYLTACKRLSVRPSEVVSFEDSAMGLQAAQAAQIGIVHHIEYPDVDLKILRNNPNVELNLD